MPELKDDLAALRIEREPDRRSGSRWVAWVIVIAVLGAGAFAGWRWATRPRPVATRLAFETA